MARARVLSTRSDRSEQDLTTRGYLAELERLCTPDTVSPQISMIHGDETKYVTWRFDEKACKALELYQITDVQMGHVCCNVKRVVEYRDWILKKPNRYMLWTGDMIDAGTLLSVGSPFDQKGEPRQQIFEACRFWAPARHRILGYVGGNHERRGVPTYGDLGTLIATLLRLPYSGGQQFIDIHFGQHKPFKIHLWHGKGASQTKGAVAQQLDRLMQRSDSQLFLMGHLHQPMIIPAWKTERSGGKVKLRKCFGALGSSFLETWGTYGEVAGFQAHDVLMPRTVLTSDGGYELTLK